MIAFYCSFQDEASDQPINLVSLAERMAASLSLISGASAPRLVEAQAIYVRQTSFGRAPGRIRRNRTPTLRLVTGKSGQRILFEGWLDNRRELAARLGVSRQTINAVETDKYDPSLPLALRMAKLFDVPVDTIFIDHWMPSKGEE